MANKGAKATEEIRCEENESTVGENEENIPPLQICNGSDNEYDSNSSGFDDDYKYEDSPVDGKNKNSHLDNDALSRSLDKLMHDERYNQTGKQPTENEIVDMDGKEEMVNDSAVPNEIKHVHRSSGNNASINVESEQPVRNMQHPHNYQPLWQPYAYERELFDLLLQFLSWHFCVYETDRFMRINPLILFGIDLKKKKDAYINECSQACWYFCNSSLSMYQRTNLKCILHFNNVWLFHKNGYVYVKNLCDMYGQPSDYNLVGFVKNGIALHSRVYTSRDINLVRNWVVDHCYYMQIPSSFC